MRRRQVRGQRSPNREACDNEDKLLQQIAPLTLKSDKLLYYMLIKKHKCPQNKKEFAMPVSDS